MIIIFHSGLFIAVGSVALIGLLAFFFEVEFEFGFLCPSLFFFFLFEFFKTLLLRLLLRVELLFILFFFGFFLLGLYLLALLVSGLYLCLFLLFLLFSYLENNSEDYEEEKQRGLHNCLW